MMHGRSEHKLLQTIKGLEDLKLPALNHEESGIRFMYLALMMCPHKPVLERPHHKILAQRDKLKIPSCLKPHPPHEIGRDKELQFST